MSETQRNFLIVIGIAVAALFVTQVQSGLDIASLIVRILFLVMITVLLWQLFTRKRGDIAAMRPVHRFVLLASAVGAYVLLLAQGFVHISGYVFLLGLALCILGIYWAWTNRWAR
jgi:predicted neutral ceramidase superfamily lipid hydrolase